jgi:hypothetical protein
LTKKNLKSNINYKIFVRNIIFLKYYKTIYINLKEKRIIRIDKTLPYITNDGKPDKETRITTRHK